MLINTRKRIFKRIVTVLICIALLAYFFYKGYLTGDQYWWLPATIISVIVLLSIIFTSTKGYQLTILKKKIKKHIWFEKEREYKNSGARREYFMALVPLTIVISGLLMWSSTKDVKTGIVLFVLSLLILAFSICLIVTSFWRRAGAVWVEKINEASSFVPLIGIVVFGSDLLRMIREFQDANVHQWFAHVFFYLGIIVIIVIAGFFLIVVLSRHQKEEERPVD